MRKYSLLFCCFISLKAFTQNDTAVVDITVDEKVKMEEHIPVKIFYSQRLINANTVEVLHKRVMDFKVTHNFGDIAGDNGGIKEFFGLDNASDVKIGFIVGLSDKFNIGASRSKGSGNVTKLLELSLKYQALRQILNDPKHPLSLTFFANTVISSMKADTSSNQENSFSDFSDRLSQVFQVMLARKFGKISLQLNPTIAHSNYVQPNDQKAIFALGGAARVPISKKLILVADYFHSFRTDESKQFFRNQGIEFYDAFGIGVEIVTEGHVFHMNFTNATSILENRFIPRTTTSWGKGKYRWGFTIDRNFLLFRDKKNK
ncbi:MAG: DUF5777 family beta-barrel protein [Bacteroidota bacterium]|nr:DUF5777 family beta-barrel protein [Bacteroidota bacterium]